MENNELIVLANGSLDPDIVKKIVKFEKQVKKIKEQEDAIKEEILKAMENTGLKKIETESLSITYVEPTTRETFDSKQFRHDFEDLYDKYTKISVVKSSIRIKIKWFGR